MAKKFKLKWQRPVAMVAGGVVADAAITAAEKFVPNAKQAPWMAPAIVFAAGLFAEQYLPKGKKGEVAKDVAMGATVAAGVELANQFVPGLSGKLGDLVLNPLVRNRRTIPGTTELTK